MKSSILKVTNLSKTYHTLNGEVDAISDISFEVREEDFLAIVGNSGCGKSTLLNILSFLDKDYKGKVTIKDNVKVGYMMQQDALFPWLNILDNATLGLDIKGEKTEESIEYVKGFLIKYGLGAFLDKYPRELSGGMQERVALIRTIALKPDIILLDEPFSALDYVSRLKVSNDIYDIIKGEGKTAIMITHDIAEAISMADRVIVLSKRPAHIKNIYDINLPNKTNPIENRRKEGFNTYFDMIWKDVDTP